MSDIYYFVIDTESYAGNFERPMCAFVTGQYGECGVGDKEAKLFEDEFDTEDGPDDIVEVMEDLVAHMPDHHGCHRPVKIWPTPGWFNHGLGGHYKESEPGVMERAQKEYNEAVLKDAEDTRRVYAHMPEYGEKEAQRIVEERYNKPIVKHPAYQSVAIILDREPTEAEAKFMRERARTFAAEHKDFRGGPDPITITGFRLLVEVTTEKICAAWKSDA